MAAPSPAQITGQEAAGLGVEDQPFHIDDRHLVATETALGIANDRFFDRTTAKGRQMVMPLKQPARGIMARKRNRDIAQAERR
jgi:hypothetical protein